MTNGTRGTKGEVGKRDLHESVREKTNTEGDLKCLKTGGR